MSRPPEPAESAAIARAYEDARWLARRRWRCASTVLIAALPPPLAALIGEAGWPVVVAPLLIGALVGGIAAAGRWSAPRGALTMTAGWLALGWIALQVPLLRDGIDALLAAHLVAVAAVTGAVLAAAWSAAGIDSD